MLSILKKNLAAVRDEIARACDQSAREPSDVTLVAVTKYAQWDWVRGLYDLGERAFGESRPQQLAERTPELPSDAEWHLIGSLQANKVRPAVQHAAVIHSVDSLKLLDRVDRIAGEENVRPTVFLQVNVSNEESKHGWLVAGLRDEFGQILANERAHVALGGLMTMAPKVESAAAARPYFAKLRALKDELMPASRGLSMGMSGDFAVAIAEGATHVRVGSRLFRGLD